MSKYAPYSAYEDTGLKWLGKVPASWSIVPLWTLYTRGKTINFPAETLLSVYRDHGVLPKSSRTDNFNNPSDDLSTYQLVRSGDLVINKMKAWQGSVAISRHRGIVSPAYFVYERHHNMDDRYLHYLLRSERYITGYLSLSKGIRINQWDLDPTHHSRMPVLVPTYEEQQQIVELLDRETVQIDELIVKQERLIELLAEKRQAIITQAVTKGIAPSASTKPSGIPWLGDVPEHWNMTKFRHFSRILGGVAPDQATPHRVGAYPYLKVGSLNILDTKQQVVSAEDFIVDRKFTCPPETLLFPKRGAAIFTNKVALTRVRSAFDTNLMGMTLDKSKAVSLFILYWLRARTLNELADTSTLPQINNKHIYPLVIALPPVSEQELILRELQVRLSKLDLLVSQSLKAIVLLKERRSALISAAVTGKIDVREGAA